MSLRLTKSLALAAKSSAGALVAVDVVALVVVDRDWAVWSALLLLLVLQATTTVTAITTGPMTCMARMRQLGLVTISPSVLPLRLARSTIRLTLSAKPRDLPSAPIPARPPDRQLRVQTVPNWTVYAAHSDV